MLRTLPVTGRPLPVLDAPTARAPATHLPALANPPRFCDPARDMDADVPDWLGPPAPHWDGRRLWLGTRVLAVFDASAWRVVAVLAAFEAGCRWADGWVADPLPGGPGDNARAGRAQLAAAVDDLNRALPDRALAFEVVGDGVWCAGAGVDGCDPGPRHAPEPADGGRLPSSAPSTGRQMEKN
jgi:hypothetical protein